MRAATVRIPPGDPHLTPDLPRCRYFADGGNPTDAIIKRFIEVCENEHAQGGALAVHCKAGLGRTGTLQSLYLMKHYGMTTPELIGWLRLCRPGSVIGPQQNFLQDMEKRMFREGDAYRRRMAEAGLPTSPPGVAPRESEGTGTSDPGTPPTAGISSGMNGLSVSGHGTPTSPAGARAVGASPNTIRCAISRPAPPATPEGRADSPPSPPPPRVRPSKPASTGGGILPRSGSPGRGSGTSSPVGRVSSKIASGLGRR